MAFFNLISPYLTGFGAQAIAATAAKHAFATCDYSVFEQVFTPMSDLYLSLYTYK